MNGKKLLAGILSVAMVFGTMTFTAFAEDAETDTITPEALTAVAQIGETPYSTLKDAVMAANDNETITLLSNASGDGIEIGSGRNITIDFGGFTYTVTGNLVGDTTPPTNAFRFLRDANVTLKNGTINLGNNTGAAILIQNYADLTIENMTLDFEKYLFTAGYALSCNRGNTIIKGETNIISPKGKNTSVSKKVYAINVFNDVNNNPTTITVDESMTGKITGNIEVSGTTNAADTQKLIIKNGTYTGVIKDNREDKTVDVLDIYGGTFTGKNNNADKYVENGYVYNPSTGTVSTFEDSLSKDLTVSFKKKSASEYEIYIDTVDEKMINGLLSADLTFDLTLDANNVQDALTYTIKPADDIELIEVSDNRFEFHYNGDDISRSAMANKIKIGTVVFEGYCKNAIFKVSASDTNIVNTTKISDSIVDNYTPGGDAITTGKFEVSTDSKVKVTISKPTKKLTVNVKFPNSINENTSDYQDMSITVSGGDLSEPIVKKLGSDATKLKNGGYSVSMWITQNTAYTVTVSGAGYRTTRYTVTMTDNKVLNFWNNVKDNAVNVEEGKDTSAKNVTFLAGDIVKDNTINIYDLSAVVSYFGTQTVTSAASDYAKYDLNRDGKIDSKDVAYVLVSWGK